MKQTTMLALAGLALSCAAHAASFDCLKAQTQIEKMICADAGLSKLDEDLASAYSNVLKNDSSATPIRAGQKQWVKERNTCLDVACLTSSYNLRIAFLIALTASSKSTTGTVPRKGTAAQADKALAPFTFGPVIDNSMANQRNEPVCLDLLDHVNHPRSNDLFKPDGTLVREGEKIKSVQWQRLDKAEYREGFMTVVNAEKAPNIGKDFQNFYADPEWILERTLAHPLESRPRPNAPEKWLYRLMTLKPLTRNSSDLNSKVEFPSWFPYTSISWLGDQQGKRHITDVYGRYGAHTQWLEHKNKTYAVENLSFIYGDGKGAWPKYLALAVDKFNVDTEGNSFIVQACALRARNHE